MLTLEREVESLHIRAADLTSKAEFFKGKVEHANDEARGHGVQVGFKVFHQLMLQLHLDFDIKALEALITLEVVEKAVTEVEAWVVVACEIASKIMGTNSARLKAEAEVFAGAPKVIEVNDVDES